MFKLFVCVAATCVVLSQANPLDEGQSESSVRVIRSPHLLKKLLGGGLLGGGGGGGGGYYPGGGQYQNQNQNVNVNINVKPDNYGHGHGGGGGHSEAGAFAVGPHGGAYAHSGSRDFFDY